MPGIARSLYSDPFGAAHVIGGTASLGTAIDRPSAVDDAVRQPTVPNTADYIQNTGIGAGTADTIFQMEAITIPNNEYVYKAILWAYTLGVGPNGWLVGNLQIVNSTKEITQNFHTGAAGAAWRSMELGPYNPGDVTQSELNDTLNLSGYCTQVGRVGSAGPGTAGDTVYALYVEFVLAYENASRSIA